MSGIQTLATLVLGGAFDAIELGENDIQPDMKLIEELQQRLVTGTDDVYVELINRAELDRVTAENAALQQRLNAADERADSAIGFVGRLIESAGNQPSIATGYLRDILDELKSAEGGSNDA